MATWATNQEWRASAELAAGATVNATVDGATASANETFIAVKATWAQRPSSGGVTVQLYGSVDAGTTFGPAFSSGTLICSTSALTTVAIFRSPYPHTRVQLTNTSKVGETAIVATVEGKHSFRVG